MNTVDIGEVIFLVVFFVVAMGAFLIAVRNDKI